VRQLENVLQRLVVLAGEEPITVDVVAADDTLRDTLQGDPNSRHAVFSLERSEREQIRNALEASRGNRARAAQMLGISRATIFRKIKEYGLS
jgi:transcriptional regulator of acetoin/glycerol metabolism